MMLPLLALLALSLSTGVHSPVRASQPGPTPPLTSGGLIWSFDAGITLPSVALGDRGGQVLTNTWAGGLELYSSFDSSQPLAEYPAGASVVAVDISPDGERFVAVRSRLHPNDPYSYKNVEMYELGGEDLVVRGRPSIGETIEFEVHGAAGATTTLLSAPRLAAEPIVFRGIGSLVLGPSLLEASSLGVIPPGGVGTFPFAIGTDPASVGRTNYHQVLTSGPRALSNDWVQLTVLP